jgi:hypothetical protein
MNENAEPLGVDEAAALLEDIGKILKNVILLGQVPAAFEIPENADMFAFYEKALETAIRALSSQEQTGALSNRDPEPP